MEVIYALGGVDSNSRCCSLYPPHEEDTLEVLHSDLIVYAIYIPVVCAQFRYYICRMYMRLTMDSRFLLYLEALLRLT